VRTRSGNVSLQVMVLRPPPPHPHRPRRVRGSGAACYTACYMYVHGDEQFVSLFMFLVVLTIIVSTVHARCWFPASKWLQDSGSSSIVFLSCKVYMCCQVFCSPRNHCYLWFLQPKKVCSVTEKLHYTGWQTDSYNSCMISAGNNGLSHTQFMSLATNGVVHCWNELALSCHSSDILNNSFAIVVTTHVN
jgi:hypothetical protein